MTIRAIRSEVCGLRSPRPTPKQPPWKRGACRSSLVDDVDKRTSAHVRCRDAVRTRGLSPTSAFLQSSTPAKRQPAHDEWQPKGPAVDLHRRRRPGSPRWESTSTARGEKVVTTEKTQSQPLGPWHPPQRRTARPIGPARSATRRSQPWAEPREWVTASRPRHGSRHLKHAPAKKTPLPLFFFLPPFPFGLIPVPQWPRPAATTGRCRSARDHLLAGCLVS